ncbi:hypothetical protein PFICI_01267 [Pestalotiopsis fici W106-1]|uniref:Uncharacterized protein n=1 Tax=Pestalotiopsis fici (strain W106-1 / CGMCC3.15140) TaxID=1229662 RepID=W3XN73_PESFW|nr:uncharacterized protein PFICI_01267 [Pestalotiopsis fici W106-1]ETS87439.1 hypothetical protein PFICI_01267 [Pestalotiopsis fici W106-1]
MRYHVSVIALLGALASRSAADTLDDPSSPYRTCSPRVATADTPFLVKGINYTRYYDDLGGGYSYPDSRWNSVAVWLAIVSNRVCPDDETGCNVSGPVCKLIDCMPLSQDASRAINGGRTIVTDYVLTVPGGAGPDGAYYDLASSLYDRHDGSKDLTKSSWRTINYADNSSGLQYDNGWRGFNMTGMQLPEGTNKDGFYPYEVSDSNVWPGWDLHDVPCQSFVCARKCINDAWSGTAVDFDAAEACINQCEGVDDVVNYCTDVGGEALDIVPEDLGFDSQRELDAYVPDGCVVYASEAFPAQYASYSASVASASSAALASSTSASAAGATASSGAISGRREAAQAGVVLGVVPLVVKVIFAV